MSSAALGAHHARLLATLALLVTLLSAVSLSAGPGGPTPDPAAPNETRALWVLRTSLTSPASIQTLVGRAREHGFNTLLVQIRGRGDAFYTTGLEPRAALLARQPDTFDPLADVLRAARAANIRVHAWVNVNLISSAVDLPLAREHVINRHPEWLMVPRELGQELANVPPASPAYVGRLARWSRANSAEVEGLYASPLVPAAAEHLEAVVRDLVRRYGLDGVHFDYARYPNERFDYSPAAIRAFRASVRPRLAEPVRRDLDTRERVDVFAYPDALPDDWRAFRASRMTALMSRLATAVRTERPGTTVSVAVFPDMREAYERKLQDWRTWADNGLVDVLAPMAYTQEAARFADQIAAMRSVTGRTGIWAGIGAYRLTPAQTIRYIQTARRLGASGIALFSYDSLADPRQNVPDYLAQVGRGAFGPDLAFEGGTR